MRRPRSERMRHALPRSGGAAVRRRRPKEPGVRNPQYGAQTPLGRVALDIRVRHPVAQELPAVFSTDAAGFRRPGPPNGGREMTRVRKGRRQVVRQMLRGASLNGERLRRISQERRRAAVDGMRVKTSLRDSGRHAELFEVHRGTEAEYPSVAVVRHASPVVVGVHQQRAVPISRSKRERVAGLTPAASAAVSNVTPAAIRAVRHRGRRLGDPAGAGSRQPGTSSTSSRTSSRACTRWDVGRCDPPSRRMIVRRVTPVRRAKRSCDHARSSRFARTRSPMSVGTRSRGNSRFFPEAIQWICRHQKCVTSFHDADVLLPKRGDGDTFEPDTGSSASSTVAFARAARPPHGSTGGCGLRARRRRRPVAS